MHKAVLLVLTSLIQFSEGIDFLIRPASNTRVLVGKTVTLRCSFSNKGNNAIYWYRADTRKYISFDRDLYEQMPRYRIIGNAGEYSLQITNIKVEDEGEYRCGFFKNNVFNHARAVIVVLVTPAMGTPKCSARPSPTAILRPGDSVSLICKSSGGRPPASLRWFREDRAIGVSRISPNEITTVLQPEDNGRKFVCRLEHETLNRPRTCSIIPLKILPFVTVNPDVLTVDVGQEASFRCIAKGVPKINKITWLLNDTIVSNGMNNRIFIRENSVLLIIKNATLMDDKTVVTCRASTPIGLTNSDSGILFVIKGYKPTTTLPTTTLFTTNIFTTAPEDVDFINANGNNTGAILGAFFGAVLVFLIVATALFVTVRLCKRRKKAVSGMNMSQLRGNGSVYSMTNDYGPAPTVTESDPSKYKTLGMEGKLPSVYQNLIENTTNPAAVTQVTGYTADSANIPTLASGQYYEVVVAKNNSIDEDSNDYETLGRDSHGIVGRLPPQRRYDTPSSVLTSNNNSPNADKNGPVDFDSGNYEVPTAVKSQVLRKSDTLDSKGYVCPKQLYISESTANSNENLLQNSCDVGDDYVDMDKKTRSIIYQQSIDCKE